MAKPSKKDADRLIAEIGRREREGASLAELLALGERLLAMQRTLKEVFFRNKPGRNEAWQ